MRPYARVVTAVLLTVGVLVASFESDQMSKPEISGRLVNVELGGVCGTLVGTGVTAASIAKTVAARGAGWVGAIISAGCLGKDVAEYSRKYNLSPEGQANLREIQRRYGGYSFEDWMHEFNCIYRSQPSGAADDVARTEVGYWDCSSAGD
jgi:uncharacterized protein YcfJ